MLSNIMLDFIGMVFYFIRIFVVFVVCFNMFCVGFFGIKNVK